MEMRNSTHRILRCASPNGIQASYSSVNGSSTLGDPEMVQMEPVEAKSAEQEKATEPTVHSTILLPLAFHLV
jgi:hypothetical protein